jgi:hypothetical protein
MRELGDGPADRLDGMFELVVSRPPSGQESRVLLENFQWRLARYRQNAADAAALVAVGEWPRDRSLDEAELAAYTAVANLILNLDEAITQH